MRQLRPTDNPYFRLERCGITVCDFLYKSTSRVSWRNASISVGRVQLRRGPMIAVLQRRGGMPGECLPSGPKRELIFRHPGLGAALHAWAAVQPGPGEESVKNTALIASVAAAAASLLIAACGSSSSSAPASTTTSIVRVGGDVKHGGGRRKHRRGGVGQRRRLHGDRHRRHQRQVVQPVGVAGHAAAAARTPTSR